MLALVAFDGQLLCLLGSTLVVFIGLLFIIQARRRQPGTAKLDGGEAVEQDGAVLSASRDVSHQTPAPWIWGRSRAEPGKRAQPAQPQARNTPLNRESPLLEQLDPSNEPGNLAGRVMNVLRLQGAQVLVEAKRENRSILRVRTQSGEIFTAIVKADAGIVDVGEVRGLYALMTAAGSVGAFMVSDGTYTDRAKDWARQRGLTLIDSGQISDIRLN